MPTQQQWKDLADYFEDTEDQWWSNGTARAYEALGVELEAQYIRYLTRGQVFSPWTGEGQPYRDSTEMFRDIFFHGHLWFYTEADMAPTHYLARQSHIPGLTYNHVLRCVHDMLHYSAQAGFSAKGEYLTFVQSLSKFSPAAIPALTAETIAQTAWVNYGRHMRRTDGSVPRPKDRDWVPLQDRPYAAQKMLLVPTDVLAHFVMPTPKEAEMD